MIKQTRLSRFITTSVFLGAAMSLPLGANAMLMDHETKGRADTPAFELVTKSSLTTPKGPAGIREGARRDSGQEIADVAAQSDKLRDLTINLP